MALKHITLKTDMNGHDFRWKMWEWEQPSFRFYYRINQNERTKAKKDLESLHTKVKNQIE